MNFQEIVDNLAKREMTPEDLWGDEIPSDGGIGPTECVFQKGGEGKGEEWERVFHFIDHNVFISMKAHYSSYNGLDFGDHEPQEVKPSEKTITVYE